MKRFVIIFLIVIVLASSMIAEETFINWSAEYYISIPDSWYHVPYNTVKIFLQIQEVDWQVFEYDAVIAERTGKPFFDGTYIFMIHQQIGEPNDQQIDSVLQEISDDYNSKVRNGILDSGNKKFSLNMPIYDKSRKMAAVKSRITSEVTDKYMLEFRKFYKKGVAIFLCYAPKDLYNASQPTFIDIVNSFSDEDLEKVAPQDSFQVVDSNVYHL